MKQLHIFGKKLAFIVAHPDDETFLAAGTIYRNTMEGGQCFVICATLGEQGKAHLPYRASEAQLKIIRARELRTVSKFLGINKVIFLNLPDNTVESHALRLGRLIKKHISKLKPDYILSFGPDGVTGHTDHISVGKAAKRVSLELSLPFIAFAASPVLTPEVLKARRKHGKYVKKLSRKKPKFVVAINPRIKLAALRKHASQMDSNNPLGNFPPKLAKDFLNYEYFNW